MSGERVCQNQQGRLYALMVVQFRENQKRDTSKMPEGLFTVEVKTFIILVFVKMYPAFYEMLDLPNRYRPPEKLATYKSIHLTMRR